VFCVGASLDLGTAEVLFAWVAVVAIVPALWYWASGRGDDLEPVIVYFCTRSAERSESRTAAGR
jgi:hypothetical protein